MSEAILVKDRRELPNDHPTLLPAPEADRAAMCGHAQTRMANKCYATCGQFEDATLEFLRGKAPKNWGSFRASVTANFRLIDPKNFRALT